MNSANGEKARDLESELLYHPSISSIHEKQTLTAVIHKKSTKMSKIQHCIFTVLLLCLLTVGALSSTLNKRLPPSPGASQEKQRFQELLNTVDPSALHEVLHETMKDKYQHGVFEKDKTAVEAIHQQNAEMAESLIELAKRQATGSSNGTVVTSTAVTTVVTSTDSVTTSPSSAPTTPVESQSSTLATSQPSTSAPESSTPPSTQPESTVTHVSTSSAGTVTTTSAPASSSESTPASTSSTLTSQASTSKAETSSETNTSPITSKTTVYTTTLANGAATTVTSVTIVPAGQADQTTGGTRPSTTGSGGSLQTGGSSRMEVGLGSIMGAVGLVVVGAL